MMCPGTNTDCENPGCRHGGCQGRLPPLPLFRLVPPVPTHLSATVPETRIVVGLPVAGTTAGG